MPTLIRFEPIVYRSNLIRAGQSAKKVLYLLVSAFFVICTFVPFLWAGDSCFIEGRSEVVAWDYIVDGDTLWLKDGRKIRFASVNAPETAHDELEAQPFGNEATDALRTLLKDSPELLMQRANRGEDQHGRVLANLFLQNGRSVEAALLHQGLAFQLFPDDHNPYNNCFSEQERSARRAGRGVWSGKPVLDVSREPVSSGFHLILGTVMAVRVPRDSDYYWVDMDGPVVLRVLKSGVDERWLRNLTGRQIETRGWVLKSKERKRKSKKYKPWIVGIYHTSSIKRIN